MNSKEIKSLIQHRRLQVLIHSCIYYELNESVVSDSTWSKWALELETLQKQNPEISKQVIYVEAFENFDHSTGCNLPLKDPWVVAKAKWLLSVSRNGDFVKEFGNQVEASKETNIRQGSISNCCRGFAKTAGGYKWRYKNV